VLLLEAKHVNDDIEIRQLREADAQDLSACSVGYKGAAQINEWWFADARDFILEGLEKANRGEGLHAGVWYRGMLVGIVCVTLGQDSPAGKADDSTARIDYGLMPAYRGKGIMTMACAALIDYSFRELPIDCVEITPDVVNVKSCAIPERLDFRKERVIENAVQYSRDLVGDLAIYVLSRAEWQAGLSRAL